MKKREDKRRWWRFGGWFSNIPEPETDSGKLRAWTRRWSRAAAILIGCSAFLFFFTGSVGQPMPLATKLGSCVGACLLLVLYARAVPRRGVKAQVLVPSSAVLAGLGMAWLLATCSLLALLGTLAGLALFLRMAWTELEPSPRALSRGLNLFVHAVSTAVCDLVKGAVLLCVALYLLFLVSTPFRPLAVQPPPAELVARYVPTLRNPSPDGTAYRMLMGLEDSAYRERYGITNAIIAEGWRKRLESFDSAPMGANGVTMQNLYEQTATSHWDRVTAGASADGALDALLPPIEAVADASVGEALEDRVLEGNPLERFFPYIRPLISLLPMEAVRRIDRGETHAAQTAVSRLIKLNAYLLRGQTLINKFAGERMARRLAQVAFRMGETRGGIAPAEARTLEAAIAEAGVEVPSMAVCVLEGSNYNSQMTRYLYRSDVRYRELRKACGLSRPQAKSDSIRGNSEAPLYGSPLRTLTMFLALSFWMGNDRSGVLQSSENSGLWNTIRAGVELDSRGPDPKEVGRQAWQAGYDSWKKVLCRGWMARLSAPDFSNFYCVDSWIHAHFAAARTALMLSAFRHETGREASTLEEVTERFGWKVPCHPLTKIPVTYVRLNPPGESKEGVSAYALLNWADGRAVKPGGGTVWLVVRNPAFGELPFRVCRWESPGGTKGGVLTHEIVLTQAPLAEMDAKKRLPKLEIPACLFQSDPNAWEAGWNAMQRAGWEW